MKLVSISKILYYNFTKMNTVLSHSQYFNIYRVFIWDRIIRNLKPINTFKYHASWENFI